MRSLFLSLGLIATALADSTYSAPPLAAIDQRAIAENACGPVSLLNAYRFSSDAWRRVTDKLPGDPESQFNYLRKKYFNKFSSNSYMKRRWDEINGIRPDDLCQGVNEFHKRVGLPPLKLTSIFLNKDESHEELLKRVHTLSEGSIKNGFPPLLHVSRFAKIKSKSGGYRWGEIASHFVTIKQVGELNEPSQGKATFHYVDPWGGKLSTCYILTSYNNYYANDITRKGAKNLRKSPCLQVEMPHSAVGKHLVQRDQPHVLIATHLLTAKKAP